MNPTSPLVILVASILTNNILLASFLGIPALLEKVSRLLKKP